MSILPIKITAQNFLSPSKKGNKEFFEDYVTINKGIKRDVFDKLNEIKTTIGNYAKHENIHVVFSMVPKQETTHGDNLRIEIFQKRSKLARFFIDMMEMQLPDAKRITKYPIQLSVDTKDNNVFATPAARVIYNAISKTVNKYKKTFRK